MGRHKVTWILLTNVQGVRTDRHETVEDRETTGDTEECDNEGRRVGKGVHTRV